MKKNKLLFIAATLLVATGCSQLTESGSNQTSHSYPTPPAVSSGVDFDINNVANGSEIIEKLGNREKGVSIEFLVSTTQDGEELLSYDIILNRLNVYEWATLHAKSFIPGSEYNEKIAGLIEHKDDGTIDVYYSEDGKDYTYFGDAYDPTVDFDISTIENYLAVEPAYMAALAAVGKGTLENIAGQQCLTFTVAGELINEYYPGSQLKVSFSLETTLIMKIELTTFTYDAYNVPVMNQYKVQVKKIGNAEQLPKMFR